MAEARRLPFSHGTPAVLGTSLIHQSIRFGLVDLAPGTHDLSKRCRFGFAIQSEIILHQFPHIVLGSFQKRSLFHQGGHSLSADSA